MRRMVRVEGPAWGIIVAAGRSERMGGTDKVFAPLVGRPLVMWSMLAFRDCADIEGIVVVAAPDALDRMRDLAESWGIGKLRAVVAGGAQRQESVRAGLDASGRASIVAVHDAARPLVTPALVGAGVAVAREHGAAVCAVPATDTLKDVDAATRRVRATIERERSWHAQTPQVFARELLLEAHRAAAATATDDAALVEAFGRDVHLYEGARWNLKVTTPDDLLVAEALLRARLDASR